MRDSVMVKDLHTASLQGSNFLSTSYIKTENKLAAEVQKLL